MQDKTYTDMRGTKRDQYARIAGALLLDRSSFDSHWMELAQFIKPRRIRMQVTDRNKGDRRNKSIIDSTATFAAQTLRSGMHAGLTSPSRPWLRLTTPDPDLAEYPRVKEWLHTVTTRMLNVFLKSNLYNSLPTSYGDLGVFGTSAMSVLEDDEDVIRTYPYPIGSYSAGINRRGIVDQFVREYQLSVRNIVTEFLRDPNKTGGIDWSKASPTIKNLWDKGNYETYVDVCWIVGPNPDYDPQKIYAKYKRFGSCYFEKGGETETFLKESGFDDFPVLVPRWDVGAEETYGTECPGMIALGDVKGLQIMTKRKAQAVEKAVNPPMQAPTSMTNQKVSILPGDTSFVDEGQYGKGIRAIHEVRLAIGEVREDILDTRYLIRRAFYEDLFLMLASLPNQTERTAMEIAERKEEKLLALGPVTERMNDDKLDPLVDRTYNIMDRAGLIPPPPKELEGVTLKIEYTSLMASAQKLVGLVGIDRFMSTAIPMADAFPETRFKIDAMQIIDDLGDVLSINPKSIVPTDEARAAMQQAQQAAAQQQQAEQLALTARAGKDLGSADMTGDSALSRIAEGVAQ